jgi:penicillin-binding protein 1A
MRHNGADGEDVTPVFARVRSRPQARLGSLLAALAIVLGACQYTVDLDPPPPASESSKILTADGQVLATLDAGEHRVPVEFDEIDRDLRDAVVAIEDHRYWDHGGVDLRAVGRALAANTDAGEIAQGGSTITQQYVRNVMLGREQTVSRKLREAALAW